MIEMWAAEGTFAGREGAEHECEAHQEYNELDWGQDALNQGPGRGIPPPPFGFRIKRRAGLAVAARHWHCSVSRALCTRAVAW